MDKLIHARYKKGAEESGVKGGKENTSCKGEQLIFGTLQKERRKEGIEDERKQWKDSAMV